FSVMPLHAIPYSAARPMSPSCAPIAIRRFRAKVVATILTVETPRDDRPRNIWPGDPRLVGRQLPAGNAPPDDLGRGYVLGRAQHQILLRNPARLVRAHARQGLDRAALAKRIWRRRPRWRGGENRAPGDGGDRRAAAADLVRHLDARAGAVEIRHRG